MRAANISIVKTLIASDKTVTPLQAEQAIALLEGKTPPSVPTMLTTKDLMRTLQVSRDTIVRWRNAGKLKSVAVEGCIRFRPEDVEALVK